MRFHDRAARDWSPPYQALDRSRIAYRDLTEGMVIAWDFRAWEVTHVAERGTPTEDGRDMRATFRRLHGPKHERENQFRDMVVSFSSNAYGLNIYRSSRVWLCSCCGDPAPCRIEVAEEVSASAAVEFEKRIRRMGPGLCYGCGEVITQRQERMTYPGDHADMPGRSGPTFHTRRACSDERAAYARRAGLHFDGGPIAAPCAGMFIRHGDGTFECSEECDGPRAQHRMYAICSAEGCSDAACRGIRDCTPDGTEVRR